MTTLLLAGYRTSSTLEAHFSLRTYNSQNLLDFQIQSLRQFCNEIVVVLAGGASEQVLRASKLIHECELVYDTEENDANLISNLRAGLHHTENWVFTLPVDYPCPKPEKFQRLLGAYTRDGWGSQSFLWTAGEVNSPSPSFFPLLVTRNGNAFIRKTKDLFSFEDQRLKINSIASGEITI